MTAEDAKRLSGWTGPARELDWNAVYTDQLSRIYNYFRFRLGTAHDIEELTSRTFEKAWRARGQYRRDLAGFSTWLFAIARNVVIDQLRADARERRLAALSDTVEPPTPEAGAQHGSDMARLAALTADLPERHRELIALKYGAALNNREIARITGLTESNVGTTLLRIVEKLPGALVSGSMSMDDQFLHRLRREPPAGFASRLKRQLDRPAPLRPTRTHLILAVAIFGTAFAFTAPVARHMVVHWFATPLPTVVPSRLADLRDRQTPVTVEPTGPGTGTPRTVRSVRSVQIRPMPRPVVPPSTPGSSAAPPVPDLVDAAVVPVSAAPSPVMAPLPELLQVSSASGALAAVLTRQALFRVMTWVMGPLYPMARGVEPFDAQQVALSADRLQQLSSLIPEVFQSDTRPFATPTVAMPTIWTQRDDFAIKAAALSAAVDALASAAADHDPVAGRRAIGQINIACNACHGAYIHAQ